jgi:hypothetical protein
MPLERSLERILRASLGLEHGNRSRAAERLRVSVRTIQRHLARGVVASEPFRKTGRHGPGLQSTRVGRCKVEEAFHPQGDPAERASVNECRTQSGEFLATDFSGSFSRSGGHVRCRSTDNLGFREPLYVDQLVSAGSALNDREGALRGTWRTSDNLLDFSRVEASRVQSRFMPMDLAVLTGGLAGSFQSLVESAGVKLKVDCPSSRSPSMSTEANGRRSSSISSRTPSSSRSKERSR